MKQPATLASMVIVPSFASETIPDTADSMTRMSLTRLPGYPSSPDKLISRLLCVLASFSQGSRLHDRTIIGLHDLSDADNNYTYCKGLMKSMVTNLGESPLTYFAHALWY